MATLSERDAIQVYEWYSDIERRLLDVVRVLPFVEYESLKGIHSPRLAAVLLETASLVDTLFRHQMPDTFKRSKGKGGEKRKATILDYRDVLEKDLKLALSRSLLLKGVPVLLSPFSAWATATPEIPWWRAYNGLKHDRLGNSIAVTLAHCVDALCGLNQLMLKIPQIRELVFRFGWADLAGWNPRVAIRDLQDPKVTYGYIAYTDFFATFLHPVRYATVEDIWPTAFRNSDRLKAHLGRMDSMQHEQEYEHE